MTAKTVQTLLTFYALSSIESLLIFTKTLNPADFERMKYNCINNPHQFFAEANSTDVQNKVRIISKGLMRRKTITTPIILTKSSSEDRLLTDAQYNELTINVFKKLFIESDYKLAEVVNYINNFHSGIPNLNEKIEKVMIKGGSKNPNPEDEMRNMQDVMIIVTHGLTYYFESMYDQLPLFENSAYKQILSKADYVAAMNETLGKIFQNLLAEAEGL